MKNPQRKTLGFAFAGLLGLAATIAAQDQEAMKASYEAKLDNFSHRVTYTIRTPDIGEIQVTVFWKSPAERKDRPFHEVSLARLVYRPELTFNQRTQ